MSWDAGIVGYERGTKDSIFPYIAHIFILGERHGRR